MGALDCLSWHHTVPKGAEQDWSQKHSGSLADGDYYSGMILTQWRDLDLASYVPS